MTGIAALLLVATAHADSSAPGLSPSVVVEVLTEPFDRGAFEQEVDALDARLGEALTQPGWVRVDGAARAPDFAGSALASVAVGYVDDLLAGVPPLVPTARALRSSERDELEHLRVSNLRALRDEAGAVTGLLRGVVVESDGCTLFRQTSDFLVVYRDGEVERVFHAAGTANECVLSREVAILDPVRAQDGAIVGFDVRARRRSDGSLCGDWGPVVAPGAVYERARLTLVGDRTE